MIKDKQIKKLLDNRIKLLELAAQKINSTGSASTCLDVPTVNEMIPMSIPWRCSHDASEEDNIYLD